ncbi:hypothetical protein CCZ20_27120 [Priestia aryabhattai]|nr:hypothetical protein CCZ20_27120 [Priestia aryabhattai]
MKFYSYRQVTYMIISEYNNIGLYFALSIKFIALESLYFVFLKSTLWILGSNGYFLLSESMSLTTG